MTTGSILVRETDGKKFTCTVLAHWSTIRADDGETVDVKWAFGDRYVGHRGPMFTLVEE